MRTVKFAFAIATSVVLSSALAAPVGADSHKKNPSKYTYRAPRAVG
jgi:hypothetical protein